jgi:hypothetical protein
MVPVPLTRGKGTDLPGWQRLTLDGYDIDALFPADRTLNIGVLLGAPSGGLVDADLDCAEAIAASILLPGTAMVWGRESAPNSHRGYVVADPPGKATRPWDDPLRRGKGARLLELRSTGGQTVIPSAVYPADDEHPTPEPCVWLADGDPARVGLTDLLPAMGRCAAAALLGRYWRPGTRHDAALALAGGLLRDGWATEDVETLLGAVCEVAGDGETRDRTRAALDTAARLAGGDRATGWSSLAAVLGDGGDALVRTVRGWLGVADTPVVRGTVPSANGTGNHHTHATAPDPGEPPTAVRIIHDYFRTRYRPDYRRGNNVHAHDGAMVTKAMACDAPTSELITLLRGASNAPRFRGGGVDENRLPGFFRTWATVAWGDLLADLPDEDTAGLDAGSLAAEEFTRLVRDVMLGEVVLADVIKDTNVTQTERRSLIDWCVKFGRPGPWRSIRSKKCWCKVVVMPSGEIVVRVAVRVELFGQMRGDRRVCEMSQPRFARLCEQYGVGTSTRGNRPHGVFAVILSDAFVSDLTAGLTDQDDGGNLAFSEKPNAVEGGGQMSETTE